LLALANRGTLFLDEVGELPLALQGQLLRVIQERTYKRVGGNIWFSTDFRLVCATNRDLLEAVRLGTFRHDLYYRIASWTVKLPPLRERTQDIARLVQHFVRQARPGGTGADFDEAVSEYLFNRDYPGNVRELRQVVSRIMDRHPGPGPVTVGDIPEDERPCDDRGCDEWCGESFERAIHRALSSGAGLKEIGRVAEDIAISIAVSQENGSLQRAANRLGVSDRALQIRRANGGRSLRSH
jgi:transcriptional regulator with PAS, ATPase and Fis domain